VLLLDSGSASIPIQNVMQAWTRSRHTGKGALIGGVVGAVAGAFLGLFGAGLSGDPNTSEGGAAIGGALVVGALGAGLGALVGAVIPGWKPL
jgi:hypothetical protein